MDFFCHLLQQDCSTTQHRMVKDTLLPEKVVHNKKRGNYATKKEKVVYRQDRKSNVSSQIRKHVGNPDHKAFVSFCLFPVP